jgi:trans-2,3-dihydro-3-hydroxyanthranilate isomerase
VTAPDSLSFDVVDVFAQAPFTGNPLAVVHGAGALSTGQMQALAREFNLSETVFPLPASQPGASYRARIFTPAAELPFAGHPSVGVAWVLARDGVIAYGEAVQECGAGLLPVSVSRTGARVFGGSPTLGRSLDAESVAAAVGLDPADLGAGPESARVVGAGLEWGFLAVRPDAVARAVVPTAAEVVACSGVTGLAVVAFDEASSSAHVRVFAPGQGVPEDPATGSAAVALGVWLVSLGRLPADGGSEVEIAQGAEMGRPSRLNLQVESAGGLATRTSVGGVVVAVSAGTIAVPGR